MSSLTHQSVTSTRSSDNARGPFRDPVALLVTLHREWRVRRQIACAQMLDGASLRDIGLASSGIESAIRHGR